MAVYYWTVTFISAFLIFRMLFNGKSTFNFRYPMGCLRLVQRFYGFKIKVENKKYLESDDPYILVVNHQSSIDMFASANIWPEGCTALAKKELRWAGSFGLMAQLCDVLFVDRGRRDQTQRVMSRTANMIVNQKMKVIVFPEGTRNHKGGLLPFKKGAFNLAVEAQIPIVPVVISSYRDFYRPDDNYFSQGDITVTCLPPIQTAGLTLSDVTDLSERTRGLMLEVFEGNKKVH